MEVEMADPLDVNGKDESVVVDAVVVSVVVVPLVPVVLVSVVALVLVGVGGSMFTSGDGERIEDDEMIPCWFEDDEHEVDPSMIEVPSRRAVLSALGVNSSI